MKHFLYKISLFVCLLIIFVVGKLQAQIVTGNQRQLLIRDSLDFKQSNTGFNTKTKEFSPIPYNDGLLFVSNKQTEANPLGFNKVYWIPKSLIGKKDSLEKSFILNNEFTAPTSNDNNILYRFNKKKLRASNNTIENKFAEFIPEESFTIDDSAKSIVYPQRSKRKINGNYKWELWEASLVDGKLKNAQKIKIQDSAADYLAPHMVNNGTKIYFSSNRSGGKGGFDIYSLEKINGVWNTVPDTMASINTEKDETSPSKSGDDLFFSSNRPGGLGGFDLYRTSLQTSLQDYSVINLGYPVNSETDDASVVKINNEFYSATNKQGTMDIVAVQYQPIIIPLTGKLAYVSDASLLPNQSLIVYDNDIQKDIDTLYTDSNAAYLFNAKPNRNYTFKVKNADGLVESFAIRTTDKITPSITYTANLKGRSPIQIKDSIEKVWAAIEQKRQDSIATMNFGSKYIVYYGFAKSYLSDKEKVVLDSLFNKIQDMPSTFLIVGAFTDCIGSFQFNYNLSVKRAKFVVDYLMIKGLPSNRFVSNGYSEDYSISPCSVNLDKKEQQNNRRAEIVLSSVANTNWAKLERERGKIYYAIFDSKKSIIPVKIKKYNPIVIRKQEQQKDTIKEIKSLVTIPKIISKKANANPTKKTPVVSIPKPMVEVSKPIVQVAAPSTYVDDEISKAEILKALDSLATLKREQERIVEYLTKRINKKPIDVFVNSDSVTIEIYDNAIHDKDSVSIIFNNRIIIDKQELKVNKPIKFKLKVDKNKKLNEMILVAENLGAEPPNTAVMFVTEKNGRKQQIMLSTDMLHNEVVYFIRIGKE
jgi:outer membrane protein OmpA-like peptidoglycan-associated protein